MKCREGADKALLSHSHHELQLKKYKKEQQKELMKSDNYKDNKTISVSKFTENTHYMNESEMKEKINSQNSETNSHNMKHRLKAVSLSAI